MVRHSSSRVLIVGGGVAAIEAALALRALAEDRVSVELDKLDWEVFAVRNAL